MARAAAVVARVSAAPTRRSAVRAAISPSRRLPASRRPPVRRRRAPTVARPGPAGPARAVTARWVASGRSEAPAVTRAPAAQPETRAPAVLAATRAPAEQVGPVERVVPRPTAARPTAARPPGSAELAELVLAAGLPATFRAARLVRMSGRAAASTVGAGGRGAAGGALPPGTAQPVAVPGPVVVRLLEAGRAGPRRAAPVRVLPSARLAQVAVPPVARARAGLVQRARAGRAGPARADSL